MTRTLFSACLALSLASCVFHENQGGGPQNPGDTTNPSPGPGPGPGPQIDPNQGGAIPQSFGPTAQQYGGNVRLTIANNSQTPICKMFISPTSDGSWGSDWLGPSEQIMPGTTRIFGVQPNSYDLKMTDCSGQGTAPGRTLGEHQGLPVQSDQVVEVN